MQNLIGLANSSPLSPHPEWGWMDGVGYSVFFVIFSLYILAILCTILWVFICMLLIVFSFMWFIQLSIADVSIAEKKFWN